MKNIAGKIIGSLFFAVFLAMGSLFVFFIAKEFVFNLQTYAWDKVECRIVASEVTTEQRQENPYRLNVEYVYARNGRHYVSTRYQRKQATFSDYAKASARLQPYEPGTRHICYVNPRDPEEAVLHRGNLWIGLGVLFPMIFVVIGLGGIYAIWFGQEVKAKSQTAERLSGPKTGSRTRGINLFFGIFFLAGFAFFFFAFLRPAYQILQAQNWPQVSCRILSSDIRSHSSSDGTTYSVDILYQYQLNGRDYKSNRYDFLGGSSSGYKGKQKIVRQYPEGSRRKCFVNPVDPQQAVLNPGFTPMIILMGCFSSVFILIGLGGMMYARNHPPGAVKRGWDENVSSDAFSGSGFWDTAGYGPVVLRSKSGPLAKLIGIIFFALFWNGFLVLAARMELGKMPAGINDMVRFFNQVPFLWIFQVIGLLIIFGVFYQLLAMFNPRPKITVSARQVMLGECIDLQWKFRGSVNRISEMVLSLEGKEEATYRRGTNTHTDCKVFCAVDIVRVSDTMQIATGNASVRIPQHTMHTFKSHNNKIIWRLKVQGTIEYWPDIKEEYEIIVLPFK